MLLALPSTFLLLYFGVLGALVGSFLNVVIARLPEGESIVRPRSRCPRCKTPIAWYHNLPVLSWLALRGKCATCKKPISVRYPLVELLMAALSAALFWRFGLAWDLVLWWPIFAGLLAIVFLDIDHWWVPDVISVPLILWAFGMSFAPGGLSPAAALAGILPGLGLVALAWVFQRLTGREGMGLGDVKLLVLIGLTTGVLGAMTVLVLGSLQGVVIGLVVMLTGGHRTAASEPGAPQPAALAGDDWTPPPRAIPFGPFLALATFEVVLLPDVFGTLLERLSLVLLELAR